MRGGGGGLCKRAGKIWLPNYKLHALPQFDCWSYKLHFFTVWLFDHLSSHDSMNIICYKSVAYDFQSTFIYVVIFDHYEITIFSVEKKYSRPIGMFFFLLTHHLLQSSIFLWTCCCCCYHFHGSLVSLEIYVWRLAAVDLGSSNSKAVISPCKISNYHLLSSLIVSSNTTI